MISPFQTASLVASPSYPNSVAWSMENLVAVASGHIVTILNPASPIHPRGLITLPTHKTFPIGAVKGEDFYKACLTHICLSREDRSYVRSISWSPLGFSPNSGSLLAVCTTEGRVMLYRAPFCEDCSEWMKVVDVSDMLFECLKSRSFLEAEDASQLGENNKRFSVVKVDIMTERSVTPKRTLYSCASKKVPMISEESPTKCNKENCMQPQITAEQYASRTALLSSLVVSWSPVLHLCSNCSGPNCRNNFTVLAIGGKYGYLSFFKICEPENYTIDYGQCSVDSTLLGFLQAHGSWITAINWLSCSAGSDVHLLLATGSSDGSLKIWLKNPGELFNGLGSKAPFSLLRELSSATLVPISTISMAVLEKDQRTAVLAIGKGSGSLETWIYDIPSIQFKCAEIFCAHDQVVTGLAWAFGGSCLYSCSQDNFIRSWILRGDKFCGSPFPCAYSDLKNSEKCLLATDPCFGLALSPGGLMIAVVHSVDPNLLNPMYQARTQKATVKFFLTAGQFLATLPDKNLEYVAKEICPTTKSDLFFWNYNILWSLKSYENANKFIVLWDVLSVLLSLKKTMPSFVCNLIEAWISSLLGFQRDFSIEKISVDAPSWLQKSSSRRIHLLNIICRRLMSAETKGNTFSVGPSKPGELEDGGQLRWKILLYHGEKELRERLVAFSFRAVLDQMSASDAVARVSSSPKWVRKMEEWVAVDRDLVRDELKSLALQIKELRTSENETMESCLFCSSSVRFESPEVAFCDSDRRHQLARCAASMQLCPIAVPLWFCICCGRSVSNLVPLPAFDSDFTIKPFCPFCGILLQRLMPDFLLSPSPV